MPVKTDDGWEILTRENAKNIYDNYFNEKNNNSYVVIETNSNNADRKKYYFVAKHANEHHGFVVIISDTFIDRKLPTEDQKSLFLQKYHLKENANDLGHKFNKVNDKYKTGLRLTYASPKIFHTSNPLDSETQVSSPPPPPKKKRFTTTGGVQTFDDNLQKIDANSIDCNDHKSNNKNQLNDEKSSDTDKSTTTATSVKIGITKTGSAIKYACAMTAVTNYIGNTITDNINPALINGTIPQLPNVFLVTNTPSYYVETIYDILAKNLANYGFIIKGFNTKNKQLDPTFHNSTMKKRPSKLTIAAFKAKHPELSDTNRYTQELIGILAMYINQIKRLSDKLTTHLQSHTEIKSAYINKEIQTLKDIQTYALKFVNSITNINNRYGHKATITFPQAFNRVKLVLKTIDILCETLLSATNALLETNPYSKK